MERLRKAILADVSEDAGMIGEMTEEHEELVAAYNAAVHNMPDFDKITEEDIEAMFDDKWGDDES